MCTHDIELLSVSLRPFYFPREFPQIFVTVVYIHPKANEAKVKETVERTISKLQNVSPDAPNFIMGDFNHCSLKYTLQNFQQYVTCATRFNETLDLCYGSVRGAYKSISNPPLGLSDHNTVFLIPVYKTVLKRYKAETKYIRKWSDDSSLALQGCFDCTNWEVFESSCFDIYDLTDVVSSYIYFFEDMLIPQKTVQTFANMKPWITKSIKSLIIERNKAFHAGDLERKHYLQKQIKCEIRRAKNKYKE